MLPRVTGFLEAQGLLWLGDLYTAFRVIITGVVLALLGLSGPASGNQGEYVSPL